ncbi:MAG: hypothetical protein PHH77_09550 [Victivallaceae bacterium]|nr:hypothetical protein [Victivallaceae bacterium]
MIWRKIFALLVLAPVSVLPVSAYEKLNWNSRALTAGKASLTSDSYRVERVLDTVNFSPEFRMPLQLVYDSAAVKNGLIGPVWQIPQLESRVFPKHKGAEWITPWGETIVFYEKDRKNKDILDIFKPEMRGEGYFAPFKDWDAKGKKGDWTISGKDDKKGWTFVYRDSRLKSISAPSGRGLGFTYQNHSHPIGN